MANEDKEHIRGPPRGSIRLGRGGQHRNNSRTTITPIASKNLARLDAAVEAEQKPIDSVPVPVLLIASLTLQSRSSSLMLVLERVFSSTRLTITAQ